jgi:predicted PurR-regulated permease PerM
LLTCRNGQGASSPSIILDSAEQIQQQLSDVALKGGQYLAGSAFLIGKGTFGFTVSFGIMLYLLFFLLKDGPYLVRLILNPCRYQIT